MPTVKLTADLFKEAIFDYSTGKEWKFKGDLPVIIDFYADWCAPCRAIAPILEELSNDYADKIIIYKVDTEVEQELSGALSIRSLPSLLFIPIGKEPMMQAGSIPKSALEGVIEKELLGNTTEQSN
jgi:thioredoxin